VTLVCTQCHKERSPLCEECRGVISAKDERARIIAWLKQEPHQSTWRSGLAYAEAIERGEHWEEPKYVSKEEREITVHASALRGWAERAKSAQVALDLSKAPEDVAIRAGQLQDLAESILRVVDEAGRR